MVFCGEGTVLDVALCIVKGLVVQSLISCVATAVFGEAAAFMLKLVGIGQDTYGLIEAIKSKEPEEIVIATVRLAISVFTLKSQCFAGDTLVSTEEGNRRIDEIKPGDKVLSYNTETGENELQEVKNVSVSKTDILVHIITDDGRDIETTMFHPFYVKNEDGTGEWKAASNLKAGDELLSEDGKKVKVSEVKVEKLAEEITVYNIELDEVHTYYAAGGVLVHNRCGTSDASDSGLDSIDDIFTEGKETFDNFDINNAYVKHKHLSTTGGNGQKFIGSSKTEAESILKDALSNAKIVSISDNGLTKVGNASYEIVIDAGKIVGTKGENLIKIVISSDGGMLSAYPIK